MREQNTLTKDQDVRYPPYLGITRTLWRWDATALEQHLLRLPPEDRYARFCGRVSDEVVHGYVGRIDWFRSVLVGHFFGTRLVAVAEIVPLGGLLRQEAELAISVEPGWRGYGLGRDLMRTVLFLARARFIRKVRVTMRADNHAMRRLATAFGAALTIQEDMASADIETGALPLPQSLAERMAEGWRAGLALVDGALGRFLGGKWIRPNRP